jgi:hypothetical protein
LDETYERILRNIPPETSVIAYRALEWLTFHDKLGFSLEAFAEGVVVNLDESPSPSDHRLLDPGDLLEYARA